VHGTNKTEKLEILPYDHCDAVGDDDYNDDSEDDYDDVEKGEEGRGTKTNTVYDRLHAKVINEFLRNKDFYQFQHVTSEVRRKPTYVCHSCGTCKII